MHGRSYIKYYYILLHLPISCSITYIIDDSVALLLHIRGVLGSDLGFGTGYCDILDGFSIPSEIYRLATSNLPTAASFHILFNSFIL